MHGPDRLARIGRSISAHGFNDSILTKPGGEIVGGESRWHVAKQLGIDVVPAIVLGRQALEQCDAFRIVDNRLAPGATGDKELLATLPRDCDRLEVDLSPTGFEEAEIACLLEPVAPVGAVPLNEGVAPPRVPATRPGEVSQPELSRLIRPPQVRRISASQAPPE